MPSDKETLIQDLRKMGVDIDLLIKESNPSDRALEQLRDGFQRMMAK